MKGDMDMETAIKEGGAAGIGLQIFQYCDFVDLYAWRCTDVYNKEVILCQ